MGFTARMKVPRNYKQRRVLNPSINSDLEQAFIHVKELTGIVPFMLEVGLVDGCRHELEAILGFQIVTESELDHEQLSKSSYREYINSNDPKMAATAVMVGLCVKHEVALELSY